MNELLETIDFVERYFEHIGSQVEVVFGWTPEQVQTDVAARVYFVPGDPSRTMAGADEPVYFVQDSELDFAAFRELWHCYVSAYDRKDPTNPAAHYAATRQLHDLVRSALARCGQNVRVEKASWLVKSKILQHGCCVILSGYVVTKMTHPVADSGTQEVFPWTHLLDAGTTTDGEDFNLVETLELPSERTT